MTITIYGLHETGSPDNIRYVGKSVNVKTRFRGHLRQALAPAQSHKIAWIRSVIARGGTIDYTILATAGSEVEANDLERKFIASFRVSGACLTNATDGGDGSLGYKQTPETIAKRVLLTTGLKRSPEVGKKIGAALRGRPRPDGLMERLRESNIGRKASDEVRAKMSRSKIGRKLPEATRASMKAAQKLRAETWKRPPDSPETRAKKSAGSLGRRLTVAHRKAMSVSALKRWVNHRATKEIEILKNQEMLAG